MNLVCKVRVIYLRIYIYSFECIYPSSKQTQKNWELQSGICCQSLGVDNPKAAFNQIKRDIKMCDPNETHRQAKHSKLLVVKLHDMKIRFFFFALLQAFCSTSFSQTTVKQPPSSYTMHGLVVVFFYTLPLHSWNLRYRHPKWLYFKGTFPFLIIISTWITVSVSVGQIICEISACPSCVLHVRSHWNDHLETSVGMCGRILCWCGSREKPDLILNFPLGDPTRNG